MPPIYVQDSASYLLASAHQRDKGLRNPDASVLLLVWQMENPDGFNTIWQYFGWGNQTLSVFTLWTITVYLVRHKKPYLISLIPALFMTAVCSTFIFVSPNALGPVLPTTVGYVLGGICFVIAVVWFSMWHKNYTSKENK